MPCSFGHAPQQMDALLVFVTVGKTAFTRLKNPSLRHQAERRQCARFEVIHAESIVHADNDPLLSNEGHRYPTSKDYLISPARIKARRSILAVKQQNGDSCATLKGTIRTVAATKTDVSQMSSEEGYTMKNRDLQATWAYHNGTKHSYESIRTNRHYLDWENQPIPFKIYSELEPIPLPQQLSSSGMTALEAISTLEAPTKDQVVPSIQTLAEIFYLSAGITKRRSYPGGEILFRAAACTGALYHIDLYLVCGDLPGLKAGVYHFGPQDFALRRLRDGDYRNALVQASGREPAIANAPAIIVCASTYWRNAWKYQSRAYRHCYWDTGTILANLLAAAAARHMPARIVLGFVDDAVSRLLSLETTREGALTLVALGNAPYQANEIFSISRSSDIRNRADYPKPKSIIRPSGRCTKHRLWKAKRRSSIGAVKL